MDINPYLRAVRALRALVEHDMAADYREGLEHCLELQRAIEALQAIDGIAVTETTPGNDSRHLKAQYLKADSRSVQGLSENGRETPELFHGASTQDADS